MKDYKSLLRAFYDRYGIGREHFFCRYKNFDPTLDDYRGSESHIGSHYGYPFRLVVLCLDAGGEAQNVTERSRTIEELNHSKLNPHMRGTLQTLETILEPWKLNNVFPHFAMVNSAKCSTGNTNKAPSHFYENCRGFIREEVAILEPELLVTQGVEARKVVELRRPIDSLTITRYFDSVGVSANSLTSIVFSKIIHDFVSLVILADREFPAITPVHPSERTGKWRYFREHCLPVTADFVRFLIRFQ